MKVLFKLIFMLSFFMFFVAPVALFVFSIEKTPLINDYQELTYDNMNRVKKIIEKVKPSPMRRLQAKKFTISEPDLNLVVNYGINQGFKIDNLFANIQLSDDHIKLQSSYRIPSTPLGDYLNVIVDLKALGSKIDIENVKIGQVIIPGVIIKPVILFIDRMLVDYGFYQDIKANSEAIKNIFVKSKILAVLYEWDPGTIAKLQERGKELLIPDDHQDRLIVYYDRLTQIVKPFKNKKVSLSRIFQPMFEFAEQQSVISNNPIMENKALIQVLALYSTNKSINDFIRKEKQVKTGRPARVYMSLKGRKDLAKHYLVSAGIAVSAGSAIANFIGLAKEVDDSDGGSGFSFADLAADKAGVTFGELAIASTDNARLVQKRLSGLLKESHFMPAIDRLPECIMKIEFKKRYKDLDSKTYTLVNNEINNRIKKCLLYQ